MSSEGEEDHFEKYGIIIPSILFKKMRKVIFKEITQYPYYKGEPDEIEFQILW